MSLRCAAVCALGLGALLLTPGASVPGGEPDCGPDEYQPEGLGWCCKRCPAGSHVSRHCRVKHGFPLCGPCEHGSFLAHENGESGCRPCTECRLDQEVVVACTQTSDRQCQCKTGSYYCDSPSCVENCFRCQRCLGAVVRPCNATHDTVCDTDAGTETPGKQTPKNVSEPSIVTVFVVLTVFVVFIVVVVVVYGIFHYCGKKKAVQFFRWLISVYRGGADRAGSTTCPRHSESLVPLNAENEQAATDPETSSSCGKPEEEEEGSSAPPDAGPPPGPSEQPAEDTEQQQGVVGGSSAAPPPPSLRTLEQEYEAKYFVRETSTEAQIYYKFEKKISDKDWKAFMRLVGLEDSEIDNCEYQYAGNLLEQRHGMLRTWRTQMGREASVFKLFAALHKMQLRMDLENIVNELLAEGILGRRAETSD